MTADNRHATIPGSPPARGADRPALLRAKRIGNVLITSGQTAGLNGVNVAEGIVGAEVDLETARACAWQCARNVVDAAQEALGGLESITSVIRVTVFVASAPGFTDQHLVGDAATQYFLDVFGPEIGAHTRSALGVAGLPTGSPVEVEAAFLLG